MGVSRISYLPPTVGQDRHTGLTCAVVHMGVPGIFYLPPT